MLPEFYVPRFSIIIPTYKELGTIPENIKKLYAQSRDVEFLIGPEAVPDDELRILEEMARKYPIKLRAHREKMGKVKKLNELIGLASGDIFVFLDSDATVENETLLQDIEKALERGDFGSGIIKIRGNSITQRCARIDYLNTNVTLHLQQKFRFSSGLNGAFIFAKREVVRKLNGFARLIVEDVDFGIRASAAGFRPVFIPKHCITTDAPETWYKWYKQRKRWYIGGAQAVLVHLKTLIRNIIPVSVQALAYAPAGPIYTALLLLPNKYMEKLVAVFLSTLTVFFPATLYLFYAGLVYLAAKYVALYLAGYVALLLWVAYWRRRFKFVEIKLLRDVTIYYTVYVPISFLIVVGAVLYTLYRRGKIERVDNWIV